MNITILDTGQNQIDIIDTFESLVWVDSAQKNGYFELKMEWNSDVYNSIKKSYYFRIPDSESSMIVEDIQIVTEAEEGNSILVTGRCLKTTLYQRIVWGLKTISGSLQDGLLSIFNENIINPTLSVRKIDDFIFLVSDDPEITALTIEAQYDGEYIYDVVEGMCIQKQLCFDIIHGDNGEMIFMLYKGADRSYDQIINPYVVFSPNFDNLSNSNYLESIKNYKNVAMVVGEGEGDARTNTIIGTASGLERREIFVDASSITSYVDENQTLTASQYLELIKTKGNEVLAENTVTTAFEGETETTNMYVYGVDYFLGDIVQIENEFGCTAKSMITEVMISEDENGKLIVPVFSAVE